MLSFPPLLPALFLKRLNRFVALVELEGKVERALVRNTGRLEGVLEEGRRVFLLKKERGKCGYELLLAKIPKTFVLINSFFANRVFEEFLRQEGLNFKREFRLLNRRFDFLVEGKTLVEVKSVCLAKGGVALFPDAPTKRGREHLRLLTELREEFEPLVVFVVLRDDAKTFKPNCEVDEEFCKEFKRYKGFGLRHLVLFCSVKREGVELRGVLSG